MKKLLKSLLVIGLVLGVAGYASAANLATATANISYTINSSHSLTLANGSFDFGALNPDANATEQSTTYNYSTNEVSANYKLQGKIEGLTSGVNVYAYPTPGDRTSGSQLQGSVVDMAGFIGWTAKTGSGPIYFNIETTAATPGSATAIATLTLVSY
jgi:hypothetical protein